MYDKAISRVQVSIHPRSSIYFPIDGTDTILEVLQGSEQIVKQKQDFQIERSWMYLPVGRNYRDLFFVQDQTNLCGYLKNTGHSKFTKTNETPKLLETRTYAAICNF